MALTPIIGSARPTGGSHMIRARDRQAIAASAANIGDPAAGKAGRAPRRQDWQEQLWNYHDQVGEFWHSTDFVGNCFSRITLHPGYLGDDDEVGSIYDDDGQALVADAEMAAELIRQLRSPLGGQSALLKAMGQNISAVGELYLLGTDKLDGGGTVLDRYFEALSTDELKVQQSGGTSADSSVSFVRQRGPGYTPEPLPPGTYPLRIWNPHPRWSQMANAAGRAQLEILEEIVLLTRTVRASSVSRLVQAGIYWIPSEIDYPGDDSDIDEEDDPFTRDLLETAAAAISDKGSAAAAVPMVARAAGEFIAKIRHDTFTPPDDALSVTKRTEAIQRFAQGIDLPVEVVTGHQQTTFANGEMIDRTTFKIYIEPKVTVILDALTVGYLRPSMMAARGLDPATADMPDDIARMVVWYDATELILPPDRSKDALEAYDRYTLSSDGLNRELGFSTADMPAPEEIAERVRRAQMLNVKETVRADETGAGGVSLADPNLNAPAVQPGAPSDKPGVVGAASLDLTAIVATEKLRAQVATAVNLLTARAVEKAGARVRSKVNGDKQLAARLKDVPAAEWPARLGTEEVARLGLTVAGLLDGEFAGVAPLVAGWARSAGRAGTDLPAQVERLCYQAASARLFNPAITVDWSAIVELVP